MRPAGSAPGAPQGPSEAKTSDVVLGSVMLLALGGLVLWALVAVIGSLGGGDDGDNPWETCEGYRADVVDGSAQDVRDSQNLRNPCD